MVRHYILISIRTLLKNRLSSLLNLIGLSLGISACIISWLFIQNEFSYDSFYSNHEDVVRISRSVVKAEGAREDHPGAPAPLTALLKEQAPAFEEIARFWPTNGTTLVSLENTHYNESGVAQADANFFEIFDVPFLSGDPRTAITAPGTAVINEAIAVKYFGNASNAMGQTLTVYRRGAVQITGVFEDLPETSHLQYKIVVSMTSTDPGFWLFQEWQRNFFHTYGLLAENTEHQTAQDQLDVISSQHIPNEDGEETSLSLWSVGDIHPYSSLDGELQPHNAFELVERFVWVSLLMVITSCFNYINMSTALGAVRAKEIALRRVAGAQPRHIMGQFLLDSFLATLASFVIAIGLTFVGLELLNASLGKTMAVASLLSLQSFAVLFAILIFITFAAGGYPAFTLSRLKPAQILQGGRGQNVKHNMRQILVIMQFSIASALILAISVVTHQNWYIDDFSRGYSPDNLVVLANLDDSGINIPIMVDRLTENPEITAVGESTNIPTAGIRPPDSFRNAAGGIETQISGINIGTGFLGAYKIPLIAGRNFDGSRINDDVNGIDEGSTQRIILSRMAARNLGWMPDEAVGQIITRDDIRLEIIGIVEDVHFAAAREPILPIYYQLNSNEYNYLTIRISDRNQGQTIAFIDGLALNLSPLNQPAVRDTIEGRYDALYADEKSQQQVLTFFSILVIVIAGLGLFALASFIIKNRTMEIAVRKVLGASPAQIVRLMLLSFNRLVIAANIAAIPISAWLMGSWLDQFHYRIDVGITHMLLAIGITLMVATLTTLGQSLRIARLRPGITLRQT